MCWLHTYTCTHYALDIYTFFSYTRLINPLHDCLEANPHIRTDFTHTAFRIITMLACSIPELMNMHGHKHAPALSSSRFVIIWASDFTQQHERQRRGECNFLLQTFVLRTLGVKTSEQSLEVLTFEWLMLAFKQLWGISGGKDKLFIFVEFVFLKQTAIHFILKKPYHSMNILDCIRVPYDSEAVL